MFGYVMPFSCDLKVREWNEYRAYYCGLCKELKREYGFLSRFFLNYDLVVLALAADSLAQAQPTASAQTCMANPVKKRPVCHGTDGLALAADALVLASFYKLKDNFHDERFLRRVPSLCLYPFLQRMRRKAAERRPDMDAVLCKQTLAQNDAEARKTQSVDEAADATAQMTASFFAAAAYDESQVPALRQMGLFLGKIIYYLDAAEDFEKDAKRSAYNVFVLQGDTKQEAVAKTQALCQLCAGELSRAYSTLPWTSHKAILDNIVFLGIAQSVRNAGKKRKKKNTTV